ncbi:hypothetical protein BO94DRAFT_592027 [Aspergillus sclerotioniger CBS 115572]|uniref:Uncharacterized protein n=1 Tax=Aspergillus sclerotioniger CBS 115572 TaxID=1450535 RepID=A0A317XF09_9EURO|nr:hypothetical protein BO94DRAFT_592027 [Aspergillus sclerotioniger CBS 115572]PWY96372.1 hypothetical protein BO94DRAFT_592027 [Aspergillus sclerotioniger CBS 115572]
MNPDSESEVYEQLELPDAESEDQHLIRTGFGEIPESKSRLHRRSLKVPIKLVSATITVLLALALLALVYTQWPPSPWKDCGNSPEEARRRGCNFDIMSFSWVLEPCDDTELTEEFLGLEDWQWFTEFNGTETVPKDVVGAGELDLWVSWKYHIIHCTYMWRKMHRAMERGRPMDSHLRSYNHTVHCSQMLLYNCVADMVTTRAYVRYPRCG